MPRQSSGVDESFAFTRDLEIHPWGQDAPTYAQELFAELGWRPNQEMPASLRKLMRETVQADLVRAEVSKETLVALGEHWLLKLLQMTAGGTMPERNVEDLQAAYILLQEVVARHRSSGSTKP